MHFKHGFGERGQLTYFYRGQLKFDRPLTKLKLLLCSKNFWQAPWLLRERELGQNVLKKKARLVLIGVARNVDRQGPRSRLQTCLGGG